MTDPTPPGEPQTPPDASSSTDFPLNPDQPDPHAAPRQPIGAVYDPDADALYVRLAHDFRGWGNRTEQITPNVHVDWDAGGHVVGVEVIHPIPGLSKHWLRIPLGPGQGGRKIDLNRLHDIAVTGSGWDALCRLMGADWTEPVVTTDMLHPATLKEMRNELDVARTEASRYRIELEASQAQVRDLTDLLDRARTERDAITTRLNHALTDRDNVRRGYDEFQKMAAAEADIQGDEIDRLRRSRNKWRRRAKKTMEARIAAVGHQVDAEDKVAALRAGNATLQTRLAAAQPVLDAARAWYDIDPLPACPIPQEEALVRAVRAWLTPSSPLSDAVTIISAEETTRRWWPHTTDLAERLRAQPVDENLRPGVLFAADYLDPNVTADEFGRRWWPQAKGNASPPDDLTEVDTPEAVATISAEEEATHRWLGLWPRSCPSCHSIGEPRDDCRDPWHPQNDHCSQCGKSWYEPACGPTHAAIAAEQPAQFPLLPTQPIPVTEQPTAGTAEGPFQPTAPDLIGKQLAEFVEGINRTLAQTGGGGRIVISTYPTITGPDAGLLNPEAPTPVPVDRVDPDSAADDDWTNPEGTP